MLKLRLSELAQSLGVACEHGDAVVTGLAIDSRAVNPGDLFVAIDGERVDGHDFIGNALDNGAAAIACTRPINVAAPHIKAADSHRVCAVFGQLMRGRFRGSVIGITGSAGKTTAKSFLESICERAGTTIATLGNQNNELGVPLTLARLSADPAFAVVEMGASQRGDIAYLKSMATPQVVVLLNALEAHLGRFGSLEAIVETKGEILDDLTASDTAVLNADQSHYSAWRLRAAPAGIISFGENRAANVQLVDAVDRGFDGSDITVDAMGTRMLVRLSIPGKGGVTNALAAIAAAIALDIDVSLIAQGIEALSPVEGRGNTLHLDKGIRLIDDSYNASPSSVMAALDSLKHARPPRTAVLADMLELGDDGPDYHREVGRHLSDLGIERVIAVGELSAHISDNCVSHALHFANTDQLLADCPEFFQDETILVKGSRGMQLDRFVTSMTASAGEATC
jgi:UDP-N-acetylmuramoyl-tripeptide--D-alanyl-D-alanine ligase